MGMARTATLDLASVVVALTIREPILRSTERIRDVDLPGMLSGGCDNPPREKQSGSTAQAFERSAWRNSATMKNEPVMQIS